MKKLNNKGMTLVEIVVVLLLSSLLMMIVSGLILNSMGFFNKTVNSDMDKRSVDTIASFVRDELIYSSEVNIAKQKPNGTGWRSFSINEKGYLEANEEQAFQNDFYNQRKLKMTARLYENDFRVDLTFAFVDTNGKQVYKTTSTVELINMKDNLSKIVTPNYDTSDIEANGYKIFYRSYNQKPNDDPDSPDVPGIDWTGTLEDEQRCVPKGDHTWAHGVKYTKDSYVLFDGVWYKAIAAIGYTSDPSENKDGLWKVLSKDWRTTSSYEVDDVVEYPKGSDIYYKCIMNVVYTQKDETSSPNRDTYHWIAIAKKDINLDRFKECDATGGCKVTGLRTVKDELCDMNPIVSPPDNYYGTLPNSTNNKGDFVENKNKYDGLERCYHYGDFVYFNSTYYRFAYKGATAGLFLQPDNRGASYKKIQEEWDDNSAYEQGDVIKYNNKYYLAYNVAGLSVNQSPLFAPTVWKEVVPNASGDAWVDAS